MLADKVSFYYKASFLDKLPDHIKNKVCVAGGCVRDKLLGEDIKDIDVFVEDHITELEVLKFLNANAKAGNINSQLANFTYEGKWIQVILGKYYDMQSTSVIDSFDFTLCMGMITSQHGLRVGPNFWEALATKHIRVNKLLYPLNSLERLQKYIKKGYVACNGTFLEIAKAINEMDKKIFTPDSDSLPEDIRQNTLLFYADGTPRFLGVD